MEEQKIKQIFEKVSSQITPSKAKKRKLEDIIKFFKSALEESISNLGISAEVFLGGSTAKGTWLSEDHDIDLFVKFDKAEYENEEISDLLSDLCEDAFEEFEELRGSRKYYRVSKDEFTVELVPIFDIEDPSEAENIMDVSPFHVRYVNENMNEGMKRDARLFKKFLKSSSAYGAETYISGLSGYAAELLIIHYGSFLNLIEEAEEWYPKEVIDEEEVYSSEEEALEDLSDPKTKSPLIIIDPTMEGRNAAASLDYDTFSKFLLDLRLFLRNPSKDYFEDEDMKISDLKERSKERDTSLVVREISGPKEKPSTFYAKLDKKLSMINSKAKKEGISVYDYGFIPGQKVKIYFELATKQLSEKKKHLGPPVWIRGKNFDEFLSEWEDIYVSGKNAATDKDRGYTSCANFIEEQIDDLSIED